MQGKEKIFEQLFHSHYEAMYRLAFGGFNMQMHTPAKLKNIFVKTLKRGTKI